MPREKNTISFSTQAKFIGFEAANFNSIVDCILML